LQSCDRVIGLRRWCAIFERAIQLQESCHGSYFLARQIQLPHASGQAQWTFIWRLVQAMPRQLAAEGEVGRIDRVARAPGATVFHQHRQPGAQRHCSQQAPVAKGGRQFFQEILLPVWIVIEDPLIPSIIHRAEAKTQL
jgi:hypothetical protein